jgi:anthranilate synthase component 2
MRALLVDAYDSFVYILKQYLADIGVHPDVRRAGDVALSDIDMLPPDFILLSPGPGHPAGSGHMEIIQHCLGRIPMLGVCLGHQALGLVYGGNVTRLPRVRHGKTSVVLHDSDGVFRGIPRSLVATRYHSLVVDAPTVTEAGVEFTAFAADDGALMGMRHRAHRTESVQFHPESIATEHGHAMLENFIAANVTRTSRAAVPLARTA